MRRVGRRGFLRRASAVAGGVLGVASSDTAVAAPGEGFEPGRHGFGFRNWASGTYHEHGHEPVTLARVRTEMRNRWTGTLEEHVGVGFEDLSEALREVVALQIRGSLNSLAATNGHCYGMVFAAQQYFERPESLPLGRGLASEIRHPTAPVADRAREPLANVIDAYQRAQVLDFFAWFGRRAMVVPGWMDLAAQVAAVTDIVDEFGTCSVTVGSRIERPSHQVLVYGYEETDRGVRLLVYDPNYGAAWYRSGSRRALEVDLESDPPEMRPYLGEYTTLFLNRYDRAIAARNRFDPYDAAGDVRDVGERLFEDGVLLVQGDTLDVGVVVVGPAAGAVGRNRAAYMNRERASNPVLRYRYGAAPGEYRIRVTGAKETAYRLAVRAADQGGSLLEATVTDEIEAGESHTYVATVPKSSTASGGVRRVRGSDDLVADAALAGGAAAVAAGLARYVTRRGSQ